MQTSPRANQTTIVHADSSIAKTIDVIEDIRQEETGRERERDETNIAEAGQALIITWRC